MTSTTTASPMTAAFWNETGGRTWARFQDLMDRLNRPIGDIVVQRGDPGSGGRVLDIGCGAGATTLDMARRLGPDGRCVGVDVSEPLLEIARQRARSEGLDQASFVQADAQDHAFEDDAFDAAVSRFGVMFFEAPDLAFANLRRALRPDGKLVFACWRSAAENPLSQIPLEVAAPLLSQPPPPAREGPGRFAFADPDLVRGVLDRSGWRAVEIAPLDEPMTLNFEELMGLSLELGALGPLLRQEDEAVQARVREAVAERLAPHAREGTARMNAACWLVEARA